MTTSFPNVTSSAGVRVQPYIGDRYFRSQLYTTYVNVDSSQRIVEPVNVYSPKLYSLCPSPIRFSNGSSILTVSLEHHPFTIGDFVSLSNVVSKNVVLKDVLSVKRNSCFVRITHINHGLSLYGMFNPSDASEFEPVEYVDQLPTTFEPDSDIPDISQQYYILRVNANIDISVQLSNIVGSNPDKTMIGNIPINQLNRKQRVYLLFVKSGSVYVTDPNAYLVKLERRSSINYRDSDTNHNSTCVIFHNLFGIPLNYLNSGTPISENNRSPYFTVTGVTDNSFDVDCSYPAIVDPDARYSFYNSTDNTEDSYCRFGTVMGGGAQCYVRGVVRIDPGFPQPNQYTYILDRTYHNVVQARIISSIFPSSIRAINDDPGTKNNRLYWRNYDDGEHIYSLDLTPGTYTAAKLETALEAAFASVPYVNSNDYHDVQVSISDTTDIVTFRSFRKTFQFDNPTESRDAVVVFIPNDVVVCEAAENLCIDFGNGPDGTGIVDRLISPFDPSTEQLFFYFSSRSHMRVASDLFYISEDLYMYTNHISPSTPLTRGHNRFRVERVKNRALLMNFYRDKLVYDSTTSINELKSFNTETLLHSFRYNELTQTVLLPNHRLSIRDIIITDQFNSVGVNQVYMYEISDIIDMNSFTVVKHPIGTKYKFVYDGLIINFNKTETQSNYTWFDQIFSTEPITTVNSFGNNNTLSFTDIQPTFYDKSVMRIRQPNRMLSVGDVVELSGSNVINSVPRTVINNQHTIVSVLNENRYAVSLPKYVNVFESVSLESIPNGVLIRYPTVFQLLFNYPDTMGRILGFSKVGEEVAITPYAHTVRNTDSYLNDYSLAVLGTDYVEPLPKLRLSPEPYFYICCDELYNYRNAMNPVNSHRVFTKIRYVTAGLDSEFILDSFVPNVCLFDDPVVLNVLNISLRYPDGNLVEFNGRDHSFTIEIVELYDQPTKTNISTRLDTELFIQSV